MNQLKKIMLTTDFSDAARMAYPFAAKVAEKFNAMIHLVHFARKTAEKYSGDSDAKHLRRIQGALTNEMQLNVFANVAKSTHRLDRQVSKSLPRFEDQIGCDLVVTAVRRRKGFDHFFLSDIGEEVLSISTRPILVFAGSIHGSDVAEIKRVLIPIATEDALTELVQSIHFLHLHFQCQFQLLIVQPPVEKKPNWIRRVLFGTHAINSAVEHRMAELKQTDLAGVSVTLETCKGIPAEAIAEYASDWQADLIVICPLGFRSGIAKRVVGCANCSVLKLPAIANGADA